jgi:hypothetical protein
MASVRIEILDRPRPQPPDTLRQRFYTTKTHFGHLLFEPVPAMADATEGPGQSRRQSRAAEGGRP